MKKKVHKLQNFYPEQFYVICIASHQNDYRLSWALNEKLNLSLKKDQDLTVEDKKEGINRQFTKYSYVEGTQSIYYHLIANKNTESFLFPDMRNIDFLLKIEGEIDEENLNLLVKEIRKINFVIIAFKLEKLQPKHKEKIIF